MAAFPKSEASTISRRRTFGSHLWCAWQTAGCKLASKTRSFRYKIKWFTWGKVTNSQRLFREACTKKVFLNLVSKSNYVIHCQNISMSNFLHAPEPSSLFTHQLRNPEPRADNSNTCFEHWGSGAVAWITNMHHANLVAIDQNGESNHPIINPKHS